MCAMMIRNGGGDDDDGHHCLHSKKVVFILPLYTEAPRFAHRVGRRLRGLLSRWVTVGLNDLRSPPTLSDDSRDTVRATGSLEAADGSCALTPPG